MIGFIGLGTMGGPMTGCLIRAGYAVNGYDVNAQAMEKFSCSGGTACASIREASENTDIIITMLPRDEHVRAAILGEGGVAAHAKKGALVLEMSTIAPPSSIEIALELKAQGLRMMDAPVGRTPADAENGTLLVMAGGDTTDFEQAKPVLDAIGNKVLHLGPNGSGIRMKVINNYMSMVGMVLTAETLAMASRAGIDIDTAVDVLQNTVAGKGQINTNYPKKVLAGDITPDFPIALGHKDLSLGVSLGRNLSVPLFLGASALELFGSACAMGRSGQDCTAMLLHLQHLSGERQDS